MDLEKLKYPVGNFRFPNEFEEGDISEWISIIENFPAALAGAVEGLSPEQLGWRYRPEGWTISQVVHHCADSHMNAFIRFKLTLTEDSPEVKPYFENLWAELPDTLDAPIEWSLDILRGLHQRWVLTLSKLSNEDLLKTYMHSEHKRTFELRQVIAMYAWHCRHHLAHISQAKGSSGSYN